MLWGYSPCPGSPAAIAIRPSTATLAPKGMNSPFFSSICWANGTVAFNRPSRSVCASSEAESRHELIHPYCFLAPADGDCRNRLASSRGRHSGAKDNRLRRSVYGFMPRQSRSFRPLGGGCTYPMRRGSTATRCSPRGLPRLADRTSGSQILSRDMIPVVEGLIGAEIQARFSRDCPCPCRAAWWTWLPCCSMRRPASRSTIFDPVHTAEALLRPELAQVHGHARVRSLASRAQPRTITASPLALT